MSKKSKFVIGAVLMVVMQTSICLGAEESIDPQIKVTSTNIGSINFLEIYNTGKNNSKLLNVTEPLEIKTEGGMAKITPVSFKDFNKDLEAGHVIEVEYIDTDNQIRFFKKDIVGEIFVTDNPKSPTFRESLLNKGVLVTNRLQQGLSKTQGTSKTLSGSLGTVFFISILASIIYSVSRNREKILANGLSGEKSSTIKANEIPNTKLTDVKGQKEALEELKGLVDFLKNSEKYTIAGARLPKGVILYGPPGTGKTLSARAIAGEAGVSFITASGADFVEKYVGVGAKRVRELFKEARKKSPSIIFIDEIDAIGGSRDDTNTGGEDIKTLNALLNEMDGFVGSENILVIAATNRWDSLDAALTRPGRFDKQIAIPLPDLNGRREILEIHMKNKKISPEIDINSLAKQTYGFSGAALESLLNESAILMVKRNGEFIIQEDIDNSYYKLVMRGNKKEQALRGNKETEIVAYHEAGHTLLAKMLLDIDVPKVTIIPSTSGAGGVTMMTPKEEMLSSKQKMESNIMMKYAGRAAEELLLGIEHITNGASQDIKDATMDIKRMVEMFGMGNLGMLNMDVITGGYSKGVNIDEFKNISNDLYSRTLNYLKDNRDKLDLLAGELIKKETLGDEDINKLLEG